MCLYTKVHGEGWKSARGRQPVVIPVATPAEEIYRPTCRATRDRNCGGKTKETEETHALPRAWSPCICNRHLQIKTADIPSVPMKTIYIHCTFEIINLNRFSGKEFASLRFFCNHGFFSNNLESILFHSKILTSKTRYFCRTLLIIYI